MQLSKFKLVSLQTKILGCFFCIQMTYLSIHKNPHLLNHESIATGMKNILIVVFLLALQLYCNQSISQKRIVVLGSSTAAGTGASPNDSSWVNRLQANYRKNTFDNKDTLVENLAVGGSTTHNAMPTGNPLYNVTNALDPLPDIILINFPSNDIAAGFSANEMMNNLRYLFQHINNNGVDCFITTTQPRNLSEAQRQIQRNLVDSININFGMYAINFWDDIVTSDGSYLIRPEVSINDGVHINNLGHRLVFERVRQKNIFAVGSPLPVRITEFKGLIINNKIRISWSTASQERDNVFEIQEALMV